MSAVVAVSRLRIVRQLLPPFCPLNFLSKTRTAQTVCHKMLKRACVFVAHGSEEMESVIIIDVLRRGQVQVDVVPVGSEGPLICSRDVVIQPDITMKEALGITYDMLVMPGGLKGSVAFSSSMDVRKMLQDHVKNDKYIAAICAAPTALKAHSIHFGKSLTSYPAMADEMKCGDHYKYLEDTVVCDGKLITSRGPGTAIPFALALLTALQGEDRANQVAKAMLVPR